MTGYSSALSLTPEHEPGERADDRHGDHQHGPDYLHARRALAAEPDGEHRCGDADRRCREEPERPAPGAGEERFSRRNLHHRRSSTLSAAVTMVSAFIPYFLRRSSGFPDSA